MKKKSKFFNKKIKIDGFTFDSLKEGRRYKALKLMLKSGDIKELELQPKLRLQDKFYCEITKKNIREICYFGDFYYYDVKRDLWVIEDVKGFETDVFKIKEKMLLRWLHDNKIKNTIFIKT